MQSKKHGNDTAKSPPKTQNPAETEGSDTVKPKARRRMKIMRHSNNYGETLKRLAEKHNFTLKEVATRAGFKSHGHFGNILHGWQEVVYGEDRQKLAAVFPKEDRNELARAYCLDLMVEPDIENFIEYIRAWAPSSNPAHLIPRFMKVKISEEMSDVLVSLADHAQSNTDVAAMLRSLSLILDLKKKQKTA